MSKVIVERPRTGRAHGDMKPGRTRVIEDDDGEPYRTRMPAKARKTKRLNENLAPLKRYLAANVGRSWNKVFSEISEHLKPTSTVQQHVRDHLQDFVAIKTRMKAGVVVTTPRWGGERALAEDHRLYYVHPRSGLLKKNDKHVRFGEKKRAKLAAEAAKRALRMREINSKTQMHLLSDGAWWEVKLGAIGDGREPDVVLRAGLSTLPPGELYGRHNVRAREKRQLNKTEKKKLGL